MFSFHPQYYWWNSFDGSWLMMLKSSRETKLKNIWITSSFLFRSDSKLQVWGYQWTRPQILCQSAAQDALPEIQSVTFEEPRTTRADSKRARTGNSSSNGEVSTQSVLKGSFFALQILAARHKIVCSIQICPRLTQGSCWKFERWSVCGQWALLRGILTSGDIRTLIYYSWWSFTEK